MRHTLKSWCLGVGGALAMVVYLRSLGCSAVACLVCLGIAALVSLATAALDAQHVRGTWLAILNTAESGSFSIDHANGRFQSSDAWNRMLGYDSDRVPRTYAGFLALLDPEHAVSFQDAMQAHVDRRTDCAICAVRIRRGDGSYHWIRCRAKVVARSRGGTPKRLVGVAIDIEQSRQLEQSTQAEIRLLALVAEHTSNAVMITDANGHIEWVNRSFQSVTGYSLEEVRGRAPESVLHGPATDPVVIALLGDSIRAGKALKTTILKYRKDNRPFWAAIEVEPVFGEGGNIEHFVRFIEDVTQRKELEEERALSEKLRSVGQLAAGIAHEINTPIQFVGDSITFLDETWTELAPLIAAAGTAANGDTGEQLQVSADDGRVAFLLEKFPVALARAKGGLARVAGIVRAMRYFAHPDQGSFARADLNDALANAVVVTRNEYKYAGTLDLDCGALPLVVCRISSISQVLVNLIVNAGHALADQGRSVDTGRITVSSRHDGAWVVIAVIDNGCGIPDDIRDRIFDPFFTSKAVGRGTGQGLAIARAIVVEQHAGHISVKSRVGAGSTFEIWLPVDGPSAAGGAAALETAVFRR